VFASAFALACAVYASAQTPVFRATTNLQSMAVQAVDRKGAPVAGLTAADFTLLEDGHPQKIAFFGAQGQPVSLAVLLDSSRSMDFARKFDRARELLAPLMAGHRPEDQILFMPFTDRVEAFRELTSEERLHPVPIPSSPKAAEAGKETLFTMHWLPRCAGCERRITLARRSSPSPMAQTSTAG
jgi:VWFA-related protein